MNEEKKPLSTDKKIAIIAAIVLVAIASYALGRFTGYNKGFDKGVGWQ
jgi:hypothetical protein